MSIWTPGGEVPIDGGRSEPPQASPQDAAAAALADLSPEDRERAEQMLAEMADAQRRILSAPAAEVVANHAMGLYELAALHLSQEPPNLAEASLATDALAGLLEASADRLGENGQALRQALVQLQLAYVERSGSEG